MIREKPIVRMRQVCKWHESSMVLEGIDLDIPKGSFLGLIATNQSTESLFMRILGQHTRFDFGLLQLGGNSIKQMRLEEHKLLKQQFVLVHPYYPAPLETTVLDHVLDHHPIHAMIFGRKMHLVEMASFHLSALGLTERFDKPVNQLERDERMLVSVVKALMKKPELILIDAQWFTLKDTYWHRMMDHLDTLVRMDNLSVIVNRWDTHTMKYLQRILAFEQGKLIQDNVLEKIDWQTIKRLEVMRVVRSSSLTKQKFTFEVTV